MTPSVWVGIQVGNLPPREFRPLPQADRTQVVSEAAELQVGIPDPHLSRLQGWLRGWLRGWPALSLCGRPVASPHEK